MQNYIKKNNISFNGNMVLLKKISGNNNTIYLQACKFLTQQKINFACYNNSMLLLKIYVGTKTLHGSNGIFELTVNNKNAVNLNLSNKKQFKGNFTTTCNNKTNGVLNCNLKQFKTFISNNKNNILSNTPTVNKQIAKVKQSIKHKNIASKINKKVKLAI